MTEFATIAAQVDGRRVLCRISKADLQKKYDAPGEDPMDVLTENRPAVEDAARKRIEDENFEKVPFLYVTRTCNGRPADYGRCVKPAGTQG